MVEKRYPKRQYPRLHNILSGMKRRCNNPNDAAYARYGGRGIFVCSEWENSDAFIEWALTHGYADNLSIDRINNDDGYYPDNCRWITLKEQNDNRCTGLGKFEYRGEKKTLLQWCTELNLPYDAMRARIVDKGMSVSEAFETPLKTELETFNQICRDHGLNPGTVRSRIDKFGWSLEKALSVPARKAGKHNTVTYHKKCPVCGKEYDTHSHKAVYCSKSCCKKISSIRYRRENPEKFMVVDGIWHFVAETY